MRSVMRSIVGFRGEIYPCGGVCRGITSIYTWILMTEILNKKGVYGGVIKAYKAVVRSVKGSFLYSEIRSHAPKTSNFRSYGW